eukprot:m.463028 g.463028  ORF g.463028 m.463028 type:complete len:1080 (+) comp57028_c0_seq4:935-4174(+)
MASREERLAELRAFRLALDVEKEAQATRKAHEQAALVVQRSVRMFLAKRQLLALRCAIVESALTKTGRTVSSASTPTSATTTTATAGPPKLLPPAALFVVLRQFIILQRANSKKCHECLLGVVRLVLDSMHHEDGSQAYVALSLQKAHTSRWFQQMKDFTVSLVVLLEQVAHGSDRRSLSEKLSTTLQCLLVLTDIKQWKNLQGDGPDMESRRSVMTAMVNAVVLHMYSQDLFLRLSNMLTVLLAATQVNLSSSCLAATTTLVLKPLHLTNFKSDVAIKFTLTVLAVPTFAHRLEALCPDLVGFMRREQLADKCIQALCASEQTTRIAFNSLEANSSICLLGNLVHLVAIAQPGREMSDPFKEQYLALCSRIFLFCKQYVSVRESNITTSHPVFGWLSSTKTTREQLDAFPIVIEQLRYLWTPQHISFMFREVSMELETLSSTKPTKRGLFGFMGKEVRRASALTAMRVQLVSQLYRVMSTTLTPYSSEITCAIAFHPSLVPQLWQLMCFFGPKADMLFYLDATQALEKEPLIDILMLACDCLNRLLVVLDDEELFEKQEPVSPQALADISLFLNKLTFKILWRDIQPLAENALRESLLSSAVGVLRSLHDLDSRRSFTAEGHWLVKEATGSSFDAALDRERQLLLQRGASDGVVSTPAHDVLNFIPHAVPFLHRVRLLRDEITRQRSALAMEREARRQQKIWVTIRRSDILNDGFREISRLPAAVLKESIKVKFVNQQGLDEAGIDENGVFKEFLEETLKQAFNPQMSLFKVTSEQRLYPSPTSYIQENHLQLFEFIGRMLGKACFDGIVIDVPFAHFFLNTMLGHTNTIDELPTLDAELAKNLAYVKRLPEGVDALELTFSVDEDVLGQVISTPLIFGGSSKAVNDQNKISYVHLMADYRLNKQLRAQCSAFIAGFRSIMPQQWLQTFSAPELQKLLSGGNEKLDIADLSRYAEYIGGYHSGHKVIRWLWEVVEELDAKEQTAFLRFVTSCSRPPVLGFATLEPRLTIRAVQEGESEDGYTLGRALLNMFSSGSDTARLPTASTCFNLLKLPMYRSKKLLKEKLRYAINAGAGFELS